MNNSLSENKYSLITNVKPETILHNVMDWRNTQLVSLRHPTPLTWDDQKHYWDYLVEQDSIRYAEECKMWPITIDTVMVAWGGLTRMVWDGQRVTEAELSFIADPLMLLEMYQEVFTFFIKSVSGIFFNNPYYHGNRLHSETYRIPGTQWALKKAILEHSGFKLEGTMREKVYREGKYWHAMIHGLLREDYEHLSL